MRIILIVLIIFLTLAAGWASVNGWGLAAQLKEPVSIRNDSVPGTHSGYFIGRGRTHLGGGFHGGK